MSANLEAKKLVVEEIKEKFSKAKTLAFVDYRGLTVAEDTALRKKFRESGCEYKVYKNRLMLKALSDLGIECPANFLEGTTAVAIGYHDEVAPAKIVCSCAKETKKMVIKFQNYEAIFWFSPRESLFYYTFRFISHLKLSY